MLSVRLIVELGNSMISLWILCNWRLGLLVERGD
jgi:hypothetical protein